MKGLSIQMLKHQCWLLPAAAPNLQLTNQNRSVLLTVGSSELPESNENENY